MTRISPAEWARQRNFSRQYAHQLIRQGIVQTVDGKVNPQEADQALAAHHDPARSRFEPSGMKIESNAGKLSTLLMTSRIRNFVERNKILSVEAQLKAGIVVNVEELRLAEFQKIRRLRDSHLAIPDRLAPVLASMTDSQAIHDLMTKELRMTLENLSTDE